MVMNMFLPSLPQMAEFYGTEYGLMQLSVPLFLAVQRGFANLYRPCFRTKWGAGPFCCGGIALFMAATVGCIFAPTAGVFLAFRMAQAVDCCLHGSQPRRHSRQL